MVKKKKKSLLPLLLRAMGAAFIINIFIISGVYGGYSLYKYCITSSYFSIADVSVKGNVSLSNTEILRLGGGIVGGNIFMTDMKTIHKAIESHPKVKQASIEKRYPSQLVISLVERTPFAVLDYKNLQYIIDEEGTVLSTGDYSDSSLPRLSGISLKKPLEPGIAVTDGSLLKGIEILAALEKAGFDHISAVNVKERKRPLMHLNAANGKIILGGNNIEESMLNFKVLSTVLKEKMRQVDTIDLSFKDKAVVTWLTN